MRDLLIRFFAGGFVVSAFAALGDSLKPKSFAGLFGAAPSVALATLGLTIAAEGSSYAALEARSMTGGAIAFYFYALCTSWLVMRCKLAALPVTAALALLWLALALGFWLCLLR